jgi:hypothetical protein
MSVDERSDRAPATWDPGLTAQRWQSLLARSDELTCYSAAVSVWLAAVEDGWAGVVNPGLWLRLTEEPGGRFGFSYFPPPLRRRLGLVRGGADDPERALAGVLGELQRSGRVIIAADGFHLPWHVACGREHVPHWFTVIGSSDALEIADPFACRNELGVQTPERRGSDAEALVTMLPAIPKTNPVHRLREELALGDRAEGGLGCAYQWLQSEPVSAGAPVSEGAAVTAAGAADGPAALRRLAEHFETRGQEPGAYEQADDIWSIARHRAFLLRYAESRCDPAASAWVAEHGAALARRWAHIAPLLMQAVLTLRIGRPASSSVPATLAELADREAAAAQALPPSLAGCSIQAD